MVNVNLLKGEMAKNGYTQKSLADELGITAKTFSNKMRRKVFGTDEAQKMVEILKIENPIPIFFA